MILVDIDLGPASGLALVRQMAAGLGRAGGACILISAHPESDYAELIADSPAVGFLAKSQLSRDGIVRLLHPG